MKVYEIALSKLVCKTVRMVAENEDEAWEKADDLLDELVAYWPVPADVEDVGGTWVERRSVDYIKEA